MFFWSYFESTKEKDLFIEHKFRDMEDEVKTLDEVAQIAAQDAILISLNQDIIKALKKRDRKRLLELTNNFLKSLQKTFPYRYYVHYHLPGAISLLRCWKPEKYGDDISSFRKMVVWVQKTGEPTWGIELGRVGLAVRGVAPIIDKEKGKRVVIGSVEVFFDLGEVLKFGSNLSSHKGIYFRPKIKLFAATHLVKEEEKSRFIPWKPLPSFYARLLTQDFLTRALFEKTYFIKNGLAFLGIPIYDYAKNTIAVYVTVAQMPSFFLKTLISTLLVVFSILIPVTLFYTILLNAEVIKPLSFLNAELHFIEQIIGQRLMAFSNEIKVKKLLTGASKEISLLTSVVHKIIEKMKDILSFRQILEQERGTKDIYQRLSRLFKEKFGLKNFVIFEVSNSANKMTPVIEHFEDKIERQGKYCEDPANCQVVKSSLVASSFKPEEMCLYFKGNYNYLCLPLRAEGKVISVVHFCLPKDKDVSVREELIAELLPYLEISSNIIAIKKYAETLHQAALYDYLTGLYNRRVLKDFVKHIEALAERQQKKVGVLMIDIDHFKRVNDVYGHRAGDTVLKECADIIKNSVRKSDLIIRYGGEEFLLLLNDTNKEGLTEVAEKLRKKVESSTFRFQDQAIKVTISLGGALFPEHGDTVEKVIEVADQALYKAKNSGRNRAIII